MRSSAMCDYGIQKGFCIHIRAIDSGTNIHKYRVHCLISKSSNLESSWLEQASPLLDNRILNVEAMIRKCLEKRFIIAEMALSHASSPWSYSSHDGLMLPGLTHLFRIYIDSYEHSSRNQCSSVSLISSIELFSNLYQGESSFDILRTIVTSLSRPNTSKSLFCSTLGIFQDQSRRLSLYFISRINRNLYNLLGALPELSVEYLKDKPAHHKDKLVHHLQLITTIHRHNCDNHSTDLLSLHLSYCEV
ncbi:uncharacterized protein BDR25DRAFT_353516 [Lindgomyces ingoldianus]|uniref:Uncharacterized protein n=1 Tax=Lindgomyces ingoldianus TaxID=673940 RepID=A0ACB6R145_9PLEO|nr:uncharacterized protein BDR25DRAFT_353516 [Lindgomyces ingoldianus]KAF2472495.1 hypothetical protein BDR25DRAFT_353516 [Lindgomyces ingoldianus]